jgi:Cu2+-containing amine oxidase
VLWKHVDEVTGPQVRRARRLVVSFHVTVANYEYLVYWRFYQDGNIECEVRATGIMVTSQVPEGGPPEYGTLVDRRTYAPFHQHFIVARLDLEVDGRDNTVYVTEPVVSGVSEDDPYGLGMTIKATPSVMKKKENRITTGPFSAAGRWSTTTSGTGWAPRPDTSWSPAVCSRRCSTRPRLPSGGPR